MHGPNLKNHLAQTVASAAGINIQQIKRTYKDGEASTNNPSIRVLDRLRKHLGADFLPAGLQSMTTRQFFRIIQFFRENIFRDEIVIQNADDVKRFVQLLEYPKYIDKSCFKAPTVLNSYEQNIDLMDWLCDFISFDDDGESIAELLKNEDMVTEVSNVFSSSKCVSTFLKDVEKCFVLWNDQEPEYEEYKLKLMENVIAEKTQIFDFRTRFDQVKSEYWNLITNQPFYGEDVLLRTQQKESEELKEVLNQLKATITEKNIEYQETFLELNELSVKNKELKNVADKLSVNIKQPAYCRQNIINEMEEKIRVAKDKRILVDAQKSAAIENQVEIAEMKKVKTSKVIGFNAITYKLFQSGVDFVGVTINQLLINESATNGQIEETFKLLDKLKEDIDNRRRDVQAMCKETATNLTSIANELLNTESEIKAHKKDLHFLEEEIRKVECEILDIQFNSKRQIDQLQNQIDELLERGDEINSKIKLSQKLVEHLTEENRKICEGIELKANALLQAKKERQARRQEALLELEQLNEQLRDVANNSI